MIRTLVRLSRCSITAVTDQAFSANILKARQPRLQVSSLSPKKPLLSVLLMVRLGSRMHCGIRTPLQCVANVLGQDQIKKQTLYKQSARRGLSGLGLERGYRCWLMCAPGICVI